MNTGIFDKMTYMVDSSKKGKKFGWLCVQIFFVPFFPSPFSPLHLFLGSPLPPPPRLSPPSAVGVCLGVGVGVGVGVDVGLGLVLGRGLDRDLGLGRCCLGLDLGFGVGLGLGLGRSSNA